MSEKVKTFILWIILTFMFLWSSTIFNSTIYYAEPPPSEIWYIRHGFGFPLHFLYIKDAIGKNCPETYCSIDLFSLIIDLMFYSTISWLLIKYSKTKKKLNNIKEG